MSKLFLFLTMISIMLVGCQPTDTLPPTAEAVGDSVNLQEMLIYPEELGWSDANYDEWESRPHDYIHPDYPHTDMIRIESRPFSNSIRYIDQRMIAQDVYVYADESTAKAVYDIGSGYSMIPQATIPSVKKIDNLSAGCRVDPENRTNHRCNVDMSYGLYYVFGFMYVDDDKITLDHWDQYMILMQEKLVKRVERDNSS